MKVLIIVILAVIFIVLYNRSQKEEPRSASSHSKPKYSRKAHARRFKIAGISHRCSFKDIGIITGKVGYDPSNEYDPNAIAVIANIGEPNEKLLGFIAKADQATFANFAYKAQELSFVGFIEKFDKEDGKGIFGKIKVYNGSEDDIKADMAEDINQLTQAFMIKNYDERIIELDEW